MARSEQPATKFAPSEVGHQAEPFPGLSMLPQACHTCSLVQALGSHAGAGKQRLIEATAPLVLAPHPHSTPVATSPQQLCNTCYRQNHKHGKLVAAQHAAAQEGLCSQRRVGPKWFSSAQPLSADVLAAVAQHFPPPATPAAQARSRAAPASDKWVSGLGDMVLACILLTLALPPASLHAASALLAHTPLCLSAPCLQV